MNQKSAEVCKILPNHCEISSSDAISTTEVPKNNVDKISNELMSDLVNNLEGDNPWNINSIYELAVFFCPECHFTSQSKQDLVNHVSVDHPWVSVWLYS